MATAAPPERSARERLLDTASELFYRGGYHAVGIDTIVERSGVSKMTLYRYFRSKDELIAAYLERSHAEFMAWLEDALAGVEGPRAKLVAAFDAVGKLATSTRCLGCTFQGAASEFPEMDHPGHRVALAHKRAVLDRFAGPSARSRAPRPRRACRSAPPAHGRRVGRSSDVRAGQSRRLRRGRGSSSHRKPRIDGSRLTPRFASSTSSSRRTRGPPSA